MLELSQKTLNLSHTKIHTFIISFFFSQKDAHLKLDYNEIYFIAVKSIKCHLFKRIYKENGTQVKWMKHHIEWNKGMRRNINFSNKDELTVYLYSLYTIFMEIVPQFHFQLNNKTKFDDFIFISNDRCNIFIYLFFHLVRFFQKQIRKSNINDSVILL